MAVRSVQTEIAISSQGRDNKCTLLLNNYVPFCKHIRYKEVILRERNRHTTRHVACTCSAGLLIGGGGYPSPVLPRRSPSPGLGVPKDSSTPPPPRLGLGVYHPALDRGTPSPLGKGPGTSHWGTPQRGHGTSGSIMGWRWGNPPPPIV